MIWVFACYVKDDLFFFFPDFLFFYSGACLLYSISSFSILFFSSLLANLWIFLKKGFNVQTFNLSCIYFYNGLDKGCTLYTCLSKVLDWFFSQNCLSFLALLLSCYLNDNS